MNVFSTKTYEKIISTPGSTKNYIPKLIELFEVNCQFAGTVNAKILSEKLMEVRYICDLFNDTVAERVGIDTAFI